MIVVAKKIQNSAIANSILVKDLEDADLRLLNIANEYLYLRINPTFVNVNSSSSGFLPYFIFQHHDDSVPIAVGEVMH